LQNISLAGAVIICRLVITFLMVSDVVVAVVVPRFYVDINRCNKQQKIISSTPSYFATEIL
jgi:hypothetical protein